MTDKDHEYFLNVDLRSLSAEGLKTISKRFVDTTISHHLGEFILLLMEKFGKKSITRKELMRCIYVALRILERDGVCYFKVIDGKFRIYRDYYCLLGLEEWKKCPEYRCPVSTSDPDWECPHNPQREEIPSWIENSTEAR